MSDLDQRRRIAAEALRQAEEAARRPKQSGRTVRSGRAVHSGQTVQSDRAPSDERCQPDERDERGRRAAVRRRRPATDPEAATGAEPGIGRDLGPDADPESIAREIVLRRLTAAARSRSELAKSLAEKDVPAEVASAVLDRMEEVGLVDDAAFAQTWVRSRQERRYLSKSALRRELAGKGVQRDDIDEALAQVEPDDEYAAATALAIKKLRSMSGLQREVKYRRLAGALARRGFGPGLTARVLGEVLSQEVLSQDDA